MLTIVDFHIKKHSLDKLIIGLAQDRTRSQYPIVKTCSRDTFCCTVHLPIKWSSRNTQYAFNKKITTYWFFLISKILIFKSRLLHENGLT